MATGTATTRPTTTAAAAGGEPLDTAVRLLTPERIVFSYPLAGPFRRASAYLIDLMVIGLLAIAAFIIALAFAIVTPAGIGLAFVGLFVLQWGYGALWEGFNNGQTPGKKMLGLRVVSDRGVPLSGAQAFLRNILWAFDGLFPFAYLPALACMMLTGRFQRLGDLAAGTMVVAEVAPRRGGVVLVREKEVEELLPFLPARVAAGPELARALADYVKRRERFPKRRRDEMAGHLADALRLHYVLPDRVGPPALVTGESRDPLRLRYDTQGRVGADAILCAFYHRVFVGD